MSGKTGTRKYNVLAYGAAPIHNKDKSLNIRARLSRMACLIKMELKKEKRGSTMSLTCVDCQETDFPILEIPEEVWRAIHSEYMAYAANKIPWCPLCLCKRIKAAGLSGVVCRIA